MEEKIQHNAKSTGNLVDFVLEIDAREEKDFLEYLERAKKDLAGIGYDTTKILEHKDKKGLYHIHVMRRY